MSYQVNLAPIRPSAPRLRHAPPDLPNPRSLSLASPRHVSTSRDFLDLIVGILWSMDLSLPNVNLNGEGTSLQSMGMLFFLHTHSKPSLLPTSATPLLSRHFSPLPRKTFPPIRSSQTTQLRNRRFTLSWLQNVLAHLDVKPRIILCEINIMDPHAVCHANPAILSSRG